MKKTFKAIVLLQAATGRVLPPGTMSDVHEFFDHLYPGIMTLGLAAMTPYTQQHVVKEFPILGELPKFTDENWPHTTVEALEMLPESFEVEGPLAISEGTADQAFEEMWRRIDKLKKGDGTSS